MVENWNKAFTKEQEDIMEERAVDIYGYARVFGAVIGIMLALILIVPMFMGNIDAKEDLKKDAGIETVYNGDATYELYTKQDIVYKKGWFGRRTEVMSSKTGKPMTVKEFKGEK